ncbi:MAG: VanW family protein [bacterium]
MRGITRYLALALPCILICLVTWDFLFWSGRFPPNCYIEKIDVSGLSNLEVFGKLRSADVDRSAASPILLNLEDQTISYKPSDIGAFISPHRTISNSTSIAYRSNYIADLSKRVLGAYKKQVIPLALEVDRDTVKAVLEGLSNSIDSPPKEATFNLLENRRYKITKEKAGKRLNIKKSIARLEEALKRNERQVKVEVTIIYPRVYANALVKYPPKYLLAEYTTYYGSHDSPNRLHNIKVATGRLNNRIIVSGETFSMLDSLGEFSPQRGFKEAFVLLNSELEPQFGGGSCQIATTLYNAALLSGLNIIERHNHGIYFTIYPLGRDASIYTGTRDLKISNNTNHPIMIKGKAADKKLTFKVYGTPTGKKVWFSRPMIFFEGEKFRPYNIMSEEAKTKIRKALLSGKPFSTYVKVIQKEGGLSKEKAITSYYKLTGDRENVKIVRPEPE